MFHRLQRIIFDRGLADERHVAERLGQRLVGGDLAEGGGRALGIVLRQQHVGLGQQGGGAHGVLVGGRQLADDRVRLRDAALFDIVERGGELFALFAGQRVLAMLPPGPAAERNEREEDRADDPQAVALADVRHLLTAQLFIDFADEGFVVLRGQRQGNSSRG